MQYVDRGSVGGACGQILRKHLLAGFRALGLHAVPVYRRALPLPSESAGCEFESRHRLRLACGNGLRGDIWEAFQGRFSIPQILEFYAATEGNFSLYNVEGRPGAIGRIPPLLAHRFLAAIVRIDATGIPVRDQDGLCIPCAPQRGRRSHRPDRHGR
jgi:hypothetical protein